MLSKELEQKYNNHYLKAKGYNSNNFPELYDQYLSLFTAYNMLYNEVPSSLKLAGITLRSSEHDNKKATELVAQYMGESVLMNAFHEQNNNDDIASITLLMEQDLFNIKLDEQGLPQKNQDASILAGLKSNQLEEKCLAILKVIYYVRCNMIHGNKDVQEYQRLLLEPLSKILMTLNAVLFDALKK